MQIGHVNVCVSNLGASIAFFGTSWHYPCDLALPLRIGDEAFGDTSFDAGAVTLGLAQADDASLIGRHTGVGFIANDVDARYTELTAKGVGFEMPPTKQPGVAHWHYSRTRTRTSITLTQATTRQDSCMTLKNVLTILDEPQHPARALSRAIDIQGKSGCHLDLVSFCWHSMGNAKEVFDKQQLGAIRDEVVGQRDMLAEQGFSTRDISLQTAWTDNIARWVEKKTTAKSCDLLVKSINKSKTLTHTPLDWQLLRTCPAPMLFATTKQNRTKKGGKVL